MEKSKLERTPLSYVVDNDHKEPIVVHQFLLNTSEQNHA